MILLDRHGHPISVVIPSMIGMLHDVDVSTTVPADGDTLVWVDADKKWEPDSGAGVRGMPLPAKDLFTASATPSLNYSLTALPLTSWLGSSVILSLNGIVLTEGTDYTVNYATGVVTLAATPVHLDLIYAEYWTTRGAATAPAWSIAADKAVDVSGHDGTAQIDTGVAFADVGADLTPGTGEADLVFGSTGIVTNGVDEDFLFLRTGGSGGIWRFNRVSGVDTDTLIHAITGLNVAATYSVSASGSTLTVQKNGVTVDTYTLTGSDATMLSRTHVGIRGTTGTGTSVDNFTAAGGVVTDSFNRPDSFMLGVADTGQAWGGI